MGLLSIIKKVKQREREMRILMLSTLGLFNNEYSGLDNAGKTTILKKFNGEDISTISPTLGFNIQTLEYKEYKLNIWDIGGQKSLRSYWRNYYETNDAVVWVVDSADRFRLTDTKEELFKLLQEEKLAGATFLIFANKQDIHTAMSPEEIQNLLELDKITTHHWKIQPCSAYTGMGLAEGMEWVVSDVASRIFLLE